MDDASGLIGMSPFLLAPIVLVAVFLLWVVSTMNRLVRLRNLVRESWAQVDVQLKRRYDLVPNLVETVKGYATYERETLERVVAARDRAVHAGGNAAAENELVSGVNRLLARAEAYPDLKASANFLELQHELANTEDRIAAARRFYNANVRDYNIAQEQFPTSLLAGGHKPAAFFEVESVDVRATPVVRI